MYLGKLVEQADTDELFDSPMHPYTRALIEAVPIPDPKKKTVKIVLHGEVPSPINPPMGCRFHPRCPRAKKECHEKEPELLQVKKGRLLACYNP